MYEEGMSISLENRKCVVFFRGQRYVLPGEFDAFRTAKQAGEEFCRRLGWLG